MADVQAVPTRVVLGATTAVKVTVLNDSGAAVSGAATATAARAVGTTLAAPAVTGSASPYTVTLTPTHTGILDDLVVTLTIGGGTYVLPLAIEVVGGVARTLAQLRTIDPLDDAATYPDSDVIAARELAERALEAACGVSFVPAYTRETLDGPPTGQDLRLGNPRVRAVRSITADGTALTVDDLALVYPTPGGVLYRSAGWPTGRRSVVVEYEHGFSSPPGLVGLAVAKLVRYVLVDSPIDDRASAVQSPDGTYQTFVTAGVRGALFSIPEANAVVAQHRIPGVA